MLLTPPAMHNVRMALEAYFPWLTTEEETQVSGSDVIDQLTMLYRQVGGIAVPSITEMPEPDSGEELGWAFQCACDGVVEQ